LFVEELCRKGKFYEKEKEVLKPSAIKHLLRNKQAETEKPYMKLLIVHLNLQNPMEKK
jgi:hypothetical protein